jgi:hypothetical protein
MMKKLVCSTALLVTLAMLFSGLALAQHNPLPTITNRPQGLTGKAVPSAIAPATAPKVKNILFYGGDGDPNSPYANGLWTNDSSYYEESASVYSPFLVLKSINAPKWSVSALFTQVEYAPFPPKVDAAEWAIVIINKTAAPPTSTVVCSGVDDSPVLTDTGRNYFSDPSIGFLGYEEYTTAVHVAGCTLIPLTDPESQGNYAEYWESVTPVTGGADGSYDQLAYESNVPDPSRPNHIGTLEPYNDSYFIGVAFDEPNLINTINLCGIPSCSLFSAGVAGTAHR